jgi:hypothetical protein
LDAAAGVEAFGATATLSAVPEDVAECALLALEGSHKCRASVAADSLMFGASLGVTDMDARGWGTSCARYSATAPRRARMDVTTTADQTP